MIREHPRFQKTAMIFISAIQVSDIDRLRGYEMGAVDYVPVPVIPEVLRAKIRVFAELYRKTRQLERFNAELEDRVRARTARTRGIQRAAARKRAAPQPGACRRQNGLVGLGLGQRRLDVGRRPVPDLRRRSAKLRGDDRRTSRPCCIPTISTNCARRSPSSTRANDPMKPSFGSTGRTAKSAGASARRPRPSTRPAAWCASAASPSTSPSASGRKNARIC